IVDLPEAILPVVTEYQYPKLVCPCCQKGTRAELRSEHVHEIGERLTAVVSYLISVRKMTRRDVRATLQDLFGVDTACSTWHCCSARVDVSVINPKTILGEWVTALQSCPDLVDAMGGDGDNIRAFME